MDFQEYIKPELLILIPVLVAIGYGLKKAEWLQDKHIPVCLGVIGIVLSLLWVLVGSIPFETAHAILEAVFTAIVQGVLVAAAAVYANQVLKQEKKTE